MCFTVSKQSYNVDFLILYIYIYASMQTCSGWSSNLSSLFAVRNEWSLLGRRTKQNIIYYCYHMVTQFLRAHHTHAFNVQRIDINDFLCRVDVMLDRPYSLAFLRSDRAVSLIKQPSLWIARRPWFLERDFVVLICNCVVIFFRGGRA